MNCPSCLADNAAEAGYCFACGAPLDPSLASLANGAIFASRFEILGPLGRGGMGMVYRAHDRELGETVAIKVLRPDIARESGRVEQRFRSEIRLARRVRHRNVCSVYGDGEDRGLLYICMELVEGENLARPAREGGGLPTAEAWDVCMQIARGLEAIHEVGIVHRDLKTANLMRDRCGIVRVMDFGIAKHHGDTEDGITVTATGTLMGTPEYMSPEQLRGEEVDFRSDLYSLAIVVYELFTGTLPFRGDSPVSTIVKQLQEAPVLDHPALPEVLRPVLARALAKEPARRYASATEMRQAVEEARSAPILDLLDRARRLGSGVSDETRPVESLSLPERVPVLRIGLAWLGLLAIAAHLVRAGGVTAAPQALSASAALRPVELPAADASVPQPDPTPRHRRPTAARPTARPRLAPTVDAARVYDESEVDVKPRLLKGATVEYPEWGPPLAKGRQVSITASYVVTESGDVTDIRVEQGGGAPEAALLAISHWKYQPGSKDGVPVKVRVQYKQTYVGG
ncbi:MAG TPA: protein kinase [Vicinamibacteria bacterium]|nr:protein kinase [Vicinamibacteria bacterium]